MIPVFKHKPSGEAFLALQVVDTPAGGKGYRGMLVDAGGLESGDGPAYFEGFMRHTATVVPEDLEKLDAEDQAALTVRELPGIAEPSAVGAPVEDVVDLLEGKGK